MGRRGPKPEPAAVKAVKGNPGHRPLGADPKGDESAKREGVLAPAWLVGEALDVWQRLAPRLEGMNLLRRIDAETFGRYCRNFANWLKANSMLDEQGLTYDVESEHGKYVRPHPATVIADRLERQLTTAEANFGLNPAERQRIFAARAAMSAAGGLFDDVPEQRRPASPNRAPAAEKPKAPGKLAGFLN